MEPAIPLNMNTDRDKGFINSMFSSIQARTSAYCFRCITCTNGCPIVLNYREQAKEKLDLLPHQLMYAVRLGLKDLVLESQMLWLCTECYMCTEYCPRSWIGSAKIWNFRNSVGLEMLSSRSYWDNWVCLNSLTRKDREKSCDHFLKVSVTVLKKISAEV
ncbi:MAG: 4Fe-4S dicluster domain-containing protein [Deltaproteobacteria bacterium]|nr:4Fe-4S dicluster domain-containing protein [Deltaproteobacteria bacterium]